MTLNPQLKGERMVDEQTPDTPPQEPTPETAPDAKGPDEGAEA